MEKPASSVKIEDIAKLIDILADLMTIGGPTGQKVDQRTREKLLDLKEGAVLDNENCLGWHREKKQIKHSQAGSTY